MAEAYATKMLATIVPRRNAAELDIDAYEINMNRGTQLMFEGGVERRRKIHGNYSGRPSRITGSM